MPSKGRAKPAGRLQKDVWTWHAEGLTLNQHSVLHLGDCHVRRHFNDVLGGWK